MINKVKAVLVAVCIVVQFLYIPAWAQQTLESSEVLFQNDFEDALNSGVLHGNCSLYQYGGDYGQVLKMYNDKQMDYNQVRFDFYNNRTAVSGETLLVSFDVNAQQLDDVRMTVRTGTSANPTRVYSDVIVFNHPNAKQMMSYFALSETNNAGSPQGIYPLSADSWIKVDIMFELTESGRDISYFVDGKKLTSYHSDYQADIANVLLNLSQNKNAEGTFYIDNLTVKKLAAADYTLELQGNMGGEYLALGFSDTVTEEKLAKLSASQIIVQDEYENNVDIKKIAMNGKETVLEFSESLDYDTNYSIKFDGFTDRYEREFPIKSFSSKSEIDENGNVILRVKSLAAVLYDGNLVKMEKNISPELCGFVFDMNTEVGEYVGGITLNDRELACSYDEQTRRITASLDGVLIGNTHYVLKMNSKVQSLNGNSVRPYICEFDTTDGAIIAKSLKWEDENGNELTAKQAAAGTKIALRAEVVNTTNEEKELYLSTNAMSDSKFLQNSFADVNAPAGSRISKTVEYTIVGNETVLYGILASDGDRLLPVCSPEYFIGQSAENTGNCSYTADGYGDDNRQVIIQVYAPGKSHSDLAAAQPSEYTNILIYQNQITADADGSAKFNFDIQTGKSGLYEIYITASNDEEYVRNISYPYIDSRENEDALRWLSNISEVPTYDEFLNYSAALGFYSDFLNENTAPEILGMLYKAKENGNFSNITAAAAQTAFYKAVLATQYNKGNSLNIFDYMEKIDLKNSEIGLYLERDFVSSLIKSDITERLKNGSYKSIREFDAAVTKAFILATVRYPDGYGNAKEVLLHFASVIGIDSSKITESAARSVSGKNYTSYGALIADITKNNSGTSGTGSSSGTGTGLSRGSSVGGGVVNTIEIEDSEKNHPQKNETETFSDLGGVLWAKEAIIFLESKGIVCGKEQKKFYPNDTITREEFTKMIVLAFANDAQPQETEFADIDDNMWYAPYIKMAMSEKLINGQSNVLFGIGENITRQDMAVITYNAAEKRGMKFEENPTAIFDDDNSIADYAADKVYRLKQRGIISGTDNNLFAPYSSATRAEAAVIVYRLYKMIYLQA